MKSNFFILLIILFFVSAKNIFPNKISVEKAKLVAKNFYFEKANAGLKYNDIIFTENYTVSHNTIPVYFVFNVKDNNGFVIVSADDIFSPVIAYSFMGCYSNTGQPEGFAMLMKSYEQYFIFSEKNNSLISEKNKKQWEQYSKYSDKVNYKIKSVDPLLNTYWGQGCYYNDSCPVDSNGSCYHTRAGCGAVAMAQIMKYHNFPAQGIGYHTYIDGNYGTLSANFGATAYDWLNMPNALSGSSLPVEITAIAQLMFHCGVSVEMEYGPYASYSGIPRIRNAFVEYFNYLSSAQILNKDHFPDSTFKNILKMELDNSKPVFYAISSGSGGHFVVCDGYQDDDYFHFNWGNGNVNGYYKLLSELPIIQEAIIDIQPATGSCSGLTEFFANNCDFDDGSNIFNYSDNADCQWLIQPPDASSVALIFSSFETESGADFVKVYDGDNISAPLLGNFSGSNLPPHLESTGESMLIHFTSNASNTASGWSATYTSTRQGTYCSGFHLLSDTIATFDDGSGINNYENDADCIWLIQPTGATNITLSFNAFNIEYFYDNLYIYDGDNTSPEKLIGSFSGSALPPNITSTGGSMLIHFNSDWTVTRPGWEVTYTISNEKIILDLKVFLEGPFNGTDMNTDLNPSELPLEQPYDIFPWNYWGSESVAAMPNTNVVDWVLVELRDTTDAALATGETIIGRQAAFLLNNGAVVGLDGNGACPIATSITNNLFVVIRHRNHLGIMSAYSLIETGGIYTYDFTTGANKAYGGTNGHKEIGTGIWGMIGGDGDANSQIGNADKNDVWAVQAGSAGYISGDFTMDVQVNNTDKNDVWAPNSGKGG
ncbi:MAG: C10 family peptidase, partial [Bacteroidales bacterium]|nr:C10 family peptidase [Bacteroidales bacterium]